jgi:hypothetical protein
MQGLHVGAFLEGELHLSWMQMFPSPFMPFYSYFFIAFFFREGTLPWLISGGDTAFSWLRAITLV